MFPLVGAAAAGGPPFFVPPAKAPAAMIPFAFATIPPGGAFDFLAPGGPAKATPAITPFAFAAFAGALNAGAGPPGGGPPVGGPTFAVGGGDFFTAGTAPVPVGGGALFIWGGDIVASVARVGDRRKEGSPCDVQSSDLVLESGWPRACLPLPQCALQEALKNTAQQWA